MPRAFFPHTLSDVTRAVDGTFGLIVGDMPDGTIWVLKRERRRGGYTLTKWSDAQRTQRLEQRRLEQRVEAINAFCDAIALGEQLPG